MASKIDKSRRCVWSYDIGESQLGVAIVTQASPNVKISITHFDNMHLYPKAKVTIANLANKFDHVKYDDNALETNMPAWKEEFNGLEARRVEAMQARARKKASLKYKLGKIRKNMSVGVGLTMDAECRALEREISSLEMDKYDLLPGGCDSNDADIRASYFYIFKLFGERDANDMLIEHQSGAMDAENEQHYAVPFATETKINMIFKTILVYGEYWESKSGRANVILLEMQASVFGVNNVLVEGAIGSILKCAPWRSIPTSVEMASEVVSISGAKKLKVYPFSEEEVSKLIVAKKFTSKHWMFCGPTKTILCERKPLAPEKRESLLPRWFKSEETNVGEKKSKKRARDGNDEEEEENLNKPPAKKARHFGGASHFQFRHAQSAKRAAGEKTSSDKRIENKKEMVKRLEIIFGSERFLQNFEGLKWIYRFKYYWIEKRKRDPADALGQALYYLADYWSNDDATSLVKDTGNDNAQPQSGRRRKVKVDKKKVESTSAGKSALSNKLNTPVKTSPIVIEIEDD